MVAGCDKPDIGLLAVTTNNTQGYSGHSMLGRLRCDPPSNDLNADGHNGGREPSVSEAHTERGALKHIS